MNVKRVLAAFCFVLLFSTVSHAQATPTSKLTWTQPNETAITAGQLTYKYYPDNQTTGIALNNVLCVSTTSGGVTLATCNANFPAFTPGSHSLQLTASNSGGESPKSVPFNFTFVAVPSAPISIGILPPT
jgi:hypothetical protein